MRPQALKNDLRIDYVEYFKDPVNRRLIVLMESQSGFTGDINLRINDSKLVIESMRDLELSLRPLRTHLLQRDALEELDWNGLEIDCSEVALMKSYSFELVSFQVISPDLLKVILTFEKQQKVTMYN
jgi:hypothetical protein